VFAALSGANPHLQMYRPRTTPERWHYRDHPRISPILGVADEGWQVLRRETVNRILAGTQIGARGTHGYDPALMSMRGVFVAAGPAFKAGTTVPAFENVHVYNLLASLLGVDPAPNDGDPAVVRELLR
jgi:predicted AlkP superfamily pyrophosphatase or phosphodiesterase